MPRTEALCEVDVSDGRAEQFTFPCACGRRLRAPLDAVGKRVRCPACGAAATVPHRQHDVEVDRLVATVQQQESPRPPPEEEDTALLAARDAVLGVKRTLRSTQDGDVPLDPGRRPRGAWLRAMLASDLPTLTAFLLPAFMWTVVLSQVVFGVRLMSRGGDPTVYRVLATWLTPVALVFVALRAWRFDSLIRRGALIAGHFDGTSAERGGVCRMDYQYTWRGSRYTKAASVSTRFADYAARTGQVELLIDPDRPWRCALIDPTRMPRAKRADSDEAAKG